MNPGAGAGTAGINSESSTGGATATGSKPGSEVAGCEPTPARSPNALTRFAVIGDYGYSGPAEAQVAALVKGWKPEFIVTTGDNNYPNGSAETIDVNIGQYFGEFICPYRGRFGAGGRVNRFFPALGNHDWYTPEARPYLDYFTLPGNERYYDFTWGSVHVFVIDSDPHEPDGVEMGSAQAQWLQRTMSASKARWQLVTMHHPPFSSGAHQSSVYMQWPYKQWGADLVLAGHDHDYERFEKDGLVYAVVGLGGASIYPFGTALEGSSARFNSAYGAALVEADGNQLSLRFTTVAGQTVDELVLK